MVCTGPTIMDDALVEQVETISLDIFILNLASLQFSVSLPDPAIRASVDALCRDDAREISRDPRTKRHIFVSSKTTTYIFMQAIGCQDVVLFALPNAFITNKQTTCQSKTKM